MLKVSLAYHSPEQVYEYFQRQVGPLYILIKQSHAIIQFQDLVKMQQVLDSGLKPTLKGIVLKISKYEEGQLDRKVVQQQSGKIQQSSRMSGQDIQDEGSLSPNQMFINSMKQRLSKVFQSKFKKLNEFYANKLSEIAEDCLDQQLQKHENSKYQKYIQSRIKKYQPQITSALNQMLGEVKSYTQRTNQPQIINVQPVFTPSNLMGMQIEEVMHDDQNAINSPLFKDGIQFINQQGNSIKRICSLNEKNFIVTQRSNKNYSGEVKIYNFEKNQKQLSLNIAQGPYSLLCYDSFVLVGDYAGKINFINLSDENSIQASQPLHYGLITEMQRFHNNGEYPSILALLAGKQAGGKDTKIKKFEVETQQITEGINSLTFHPKGEVLCGSTTLSFEVLSNQRFAYGTQKKLIIFNQNSNLRQTILLDYNIFKIRKFNQNQLIVSTQADISIVDPRLQRQIDKFYTFKYGIRAIEPISQNYLFFGAQTGQVGVLDRRRTAQILWQNREVHTSKICDLTKVQKSVISGDNAGIIMKWQNIEM